MNLKQSLRFGVLALLSIVTACGERGGDRSASAATDSRIPSADLPLPPGPPLRVADNGDGTYTNPPLYADYPDPSIIRVGDTFYFATTTFVNVPGMTILESGDLVNWRLAAHVVPVLDGLPQYDMQGGTRYRRGLYAPSLRYHDGRFWLAVTPVGQNTRIYYTDDVRSPWQYHELDREAFDPALFFDDDGAVYLATSTGADGTVTLLTLSDDLSTVTSSQAVYYNEGAEGSKILRRGDWYYLFNAIPRRLAMTVSRARSLLGPWETRDQIDDTTGGHQGAIVDLPDGSDYGFVMVDAGSVGRMTNLSPIHWEDGWPVWGTPDAPGRVPAVAAKPIGGAATGQPDTSDAFDNADLGLQWQWNHNPVDSQWSLTERAGFLRLRALPADGFWNARNTLVQKGMGPASRGDVKLDIRHLAPGDECGFGTLGKYSAYIAVVGGEGGRHTLAMRVLEDTGDGARETLRADGVPANADRIYLRTELDFVNDAGRTAYSFDAQHWTGLGGDFPLQFDWRTGTFQGQQYAIFCFSRGSGGGYLDVDEFRMSGLEPL